MTSKKLILVGFVLILAPSGLAQSRSKLQKRAPKPPARAFVVLKAQSLSAIEQNKTEELFGGAGFELRVAVERESNKAATGAESHDAADDIYYVLEGSATLTLGGKLDSPREVQPGEWLGAGIIGGQTFEVAKGDLIIVPRGTPHQRSTLGRDFSMILIKVFAARK
jgi:quercetin dioxygenase-like cupin family protein